jgi:hypothetical protein
VSSAASMTLTFAKHIEHGIGVVATASMNFLSRSMFTSFSSGVSSNFFAASAFFFGNNWSM